MITKFLYDVNDNDKAGCNENYMEDVKNAFLQRF